jgi:hypothetical protein
MLNIWNIIYDKLFRIDKIKRLACFSMADKKKRHTTTEVADAQL